MSYYDITQAVAGADGLTGEEATLVRELVQLWREKKSRNDLRDEYYFNHVKAKGLGIAIAPELEGRIDARVNWPSRAVDYFAARSLFNGFAADETAEYTVRGIAQANSMGLLYRKALDCELRHGCAAWTVTAGDDGQPVVSAYPLTAAALLWNDALKEVAAGLVVSASKKKPDGEEREPTEFKLFTRDALTIIGKGPSGWVAERMEHSMGRPLIEPMAYRPTLERPFGRSRITRALMSLTDDAQRERERAEVAAEFASWPQKYLLGTDKKTIQEGQRYAAYIGGILEATRGKDGTVPQFGQLSQLSMEPHVSYMRSLALQASAETCVPATAFGVVTDNPTSADAILAMKEDLVLDVAAANAVNGKALVNVMHMALAVADGTDFAQARERFGGVAARFRSPATPSVVSMSDAMLKQVQGVPWLADTSVILERLDYADEEIVRMQADKRRSEGRQVVEQMMGGGGGEAGAQAA